MSKQVEIFTDGSCLGNPGAGGYGIIFRFKKYEKIFSKGYYITTNNRMEIMAPIIALKKLNASYNIIIITDSTYLHHGIMYWRNNWKKRNWKTTNNKPIKNLDLWKKLDDLLLNYNNIKWKWIKSHSGNINNERCDTLAKIAANNPKFNDFGYKNNIKY